MGVMTPFVTQVATLGFAIIPAFLGQDDLLTLERSLPHPSAERGGVRNLLDIPAVADLADADQMRSLIDPILGSDAFPVRGILFDKTPATNWRVSWHQDLTIAVTKRVEAPAYGPWSEKDGVVHVQPPAAVLERMVAVRLHLDHSGAENGPLRVLPGSHRARSCFTHRRRQSSQTTGESFISSMRAPCWLRDSNGAGLGAVPVLPNKRLKLPGGDRSSGSGVLCPGGHELSFNYTARGARVARS